MCVCQTRNSVHAEHRGADMTRQICCMPSCAYWPRSPDWKPQLTSTIEVHSLRFLVHHKKTSTWLYRPWVCVSSETKWSATIGAPPWLDIFCPVGEQFRSCILALHLHTITVGEPPCGKRCLKPGCSCIMILTKISCISTWQTCFCIAIGLT